MTLSVTVGKWGGFYFCREWCWRLCLGWLALTWFPQDLDQFLAWALDEKDKLRAPSVEEADDDP